MPNTANGFGLDSLGYLPADVLNALLPYLTYSSNQAYDLTNLAATAQANQQQNATSAANAAMQAQATLGAAGIGASASTANQNSQNQTSASIANAQIASDIIRAAYGDKNAAARLDSTNYLQAQSLNQAFQAQILGQLGSTGLRDQLQARAMTRGVGTQPGFGSALGVLNQPLMQVQAQPTKWYDYPTAPTASAASSAGSSFTMPSIGGGGGGGGGGVDVGSLYSQFLDSLNGQIGNFGINYAPPASTSGQKTVANSPYTYLSDHPTAPFTPSMYGWKTNTGQTLARGGESKSMAWVGEGKHGEGFQMGTAELVQKTKGGFKVIPMSEMTMMAGGGTVPYRPPTVTASRDAPPSPSMPPLNTSPALTTYGTPPPPHGSPAANPYTPETNPLEFNQYSMPNPYLRMIPKSPPKAPSALTGGVEAGPNNSTWVGPGSNAQSNPNTQANTSGSPTTTIAPNGTVTINHPADSLTTGEEIKKLPAFKALMGQGFSASYPGNQTFDLPEYGLKGIPGPAQAAFLLSAGSPLSTPEKEDILTLLQAGGYDPQAVASIVSSFTPGARGGFSAQAVGY